MYICVPIFYIGYFFTKFNIMRYVINLVTFLLIITPLKANLHTVTEAPFVVPTKCNEKELKLLAKLIYSESPHEPYMGKLAVGNVVINRMSRTGKSFHNPKTSTDSKWVRKISKHRYKKIGRHLFCHRPA